VKACGFAMTGQTADIAPADKKLYAMRDATATVPYIPLIVGSIMSKKLAEGLNVLVLDVKTGSGAFMRSLEDSKQLAQALVRTGNAFGVKSQAVVSDMNQPLGKYAGNALEVYECVKIMRNEADDAAASTRDLSLELAARMLVLAGASPSIDDARKTVETKLRNGSALEIFKQNIELQNGDPRVCDDPELLLEKNVVECSIEASSTGIVTEIDTFRIGNALIDLGGGRIKAEDSVDPAVGFCSHVRIGSAVRNGELLGIAYCRTDEQADKVGEKLRSAFTVANDVPVVKPKLIHAIVG
jgi:pyrimidine-nucleoside phosphorylase